MSRTGEKSARAWLVLAAVFAMCWFVLWLSVGRDKHELLQKAHASTVSDIPLPTSIDELNEFRNEVTPISFDAITRDLRSYPKEFKNKEFFEKNRKKWTVQVMDVSENKIVVDYLDGRDDREQFAYFRYTNANGQQRYMLTYGVMGSFQEAMGASKLVDFKLPSSMRVLPESMERYLGMVDNYVLPDQAVELAPKKQVQLKETTKEVAPEPVIAEEEVTELDPVVDTMEPEAKPTSDSPKKEPAKKESSKSTQTTEKTDKKAEDKPESKKQKPKPVELPPPPTAKPVDIGTLPVAPAFDELGQ